MDFGIRGAALLVLVLAPGLASAQQGVTMSQVNPGGSVTQNSFTYGSAGGPAAVAPSPGPNGTFKYWDVLSTPGTPTNYYSQPPYVTAPRQPQVAVGPNDIFVVVNKSIARYANPNGSGNTGAANPLNYPAMETAWMDTWLGIANLAPLCPSGPSYQCTIDNLSIRYDQLQGRFVVLFTVTNIPGHRSNFVLIVSKLSQFAAGPLFTPTTIAQIGGSNQPSFAVANWFYYTIPVNLSYSTAPTALGNGVVGTAGMVTTGGQSGIPFVSAPFCPNGGPAVPYTTGAGGTERSCTNYFPTAARMGIDHDNITLVAPVVDQMNNNAPEGTLPSFSGTGADNLPFSLGPYAGTRVVTVPKLYLYNAIAPPTTQPPACEPGGCGAVNLSDNIATGTLTEVAGCNVAAPVGPCAPSGPANARTQPIRAIYWEPGNLRGRALASFDAQVAPKADGPAAGVFTPIDYLVGHQVFSNTGAVVNSNQILLQPIVFSCPSSAINAGVEGLFYCGASGGGQVPDVPVLGPLQSSAATVAAQVTNPNPVGQGNADDGTPETNNRLFVGDSRPAQVIYREGLLYEDRSVRPFDHSGNPLGTSTVLYDVLRNCPTNSGPSCAYSAGGSALTAAILAQEYGWFNGPNEPDPSGDPSGFGFYAPMFDSPADVAGSGGVSPLNVFAWLEKLFVGMTTGGPGNQTGVFSNNFPSLWGFRPGDDAYDTVEPYVDPYVGTIFTTVPCSGSINVYGNLTTGSRTITNIVNTNGIQPGMFINGFGVPPGSVVSQVTPNTSVTWSTATGAATSNFNNDSLSFTTQGPATSELASLLPNGSNQITVGNAPPAGVNVGAQVTGANVTATTAGLQNAYGCPHGVPCAGAGFIGLIGVTSLANLAPGMTVTAASATVAINVSFQAGSTTATVPAPTSSGGYIFAGDTVDCASTAGTAPNACQGGTIVTAGNGANGTTITLSHPAAVTGALLMIFSTDVLPDGATIVRTVTNGTTFQIQLDRALAGPMPIGRTISFTSTGLIPENTTVSGFGSNGAITLSNKITLSGIVSTCPGMGLCTGSTAKAAGSGVPLTFTDNSGLTPPGGMCPLIPWGDRGGASTDPNDGSLWAYGAFAKQRLATIPGPGQWGTAIANFGLNFLTDSPDNGDGGRDHRFFGDVQQGSSAFPWIQIAENLNLAPAAGDADDSITRAEAAYWLVRGQMDETAVTNFLCATSGDPSGLATCPGIPPGTAASIFGDLGSGGSKIDNPFAPGDFHGFPWVTNAMLMRYIEVMGRRGYAKPVSGPCQAHGDNAVVRFCPNDLVTRGQIAEFLIRAKMGNLFATSLLGAGAGGDNFQSLLPSAPFFTDVNGGNEFFIYVQEMRELGLATGTTYGPNNPVSRGDVAMFVVKAFLL